MNTKVLSAFLKTCVVLLTIWSPPAVLFSQGGWTASPFDQKVFIENKGQFNEKMTDGNTYLPAGMAPTVLFGASCEGVELYFTSRGLTYKHDEAPHPPEGGRSSEEVGDIPPSGGGGAVHYLSMEWIGANPNAEITAEEPVSFYYTYGGEGKDAIATIKANAYKKIIYKNLYQNIDAEYIFPSDSMGIKYSLVLHPGANPSDIKMKWSGDNIFLDKNGNLIIKTSMGEFIDHAPKTFYISPIPKMGERYPAQDGYENGQRIESSFELSGNTVSFKIPPLGGGGAVIDPWTTNPSFTGNNEAYDVNYDMNGNVYILGSYGPFQLVKLNSTGTIQWVFNAAGLGYFLAFGNYNYGDFAVDEISGTSYLVEGFPNGRIFKVNTMGIQTGTFPGTGNPKLEELWRVEYNRCINKIVIAGGGTGSTYQAAMLDTNMGNITPVNVLSTFLPFNDMALLAIDNSNFCYMASAGRPGFSANTLIKCPIPSLVPLSFSVPDGHLFGEARSVTYVNDVGPFYNPNGLNGMAVSPAWLYTYDSDSLKRWDKNTGAFSAGVNVSPSPPLINNNIVFGPAIKVSWGGLSADECDNIYAGMKTSIMQYNTALSLVNTFPLPDTVYDVKMGPNNKLYACGKGFVTQIDVSNVTAVQTPASGCGICDGTATIGIACNNLSGFSYSWSTSPVQTTQTATGLCPGNYTVTVTAPVTNCSNGFTGTGAVTVTGGSGALSATVTATPAVCNNNAGSATVGIIGGTTPYTYLWSPSGGTNATATGLAAGNYTAVITDANGCSTTQAVTVVSSGSVTATNQPAGICSGSTYTLPGGTIVSTGGIYNDTLASAGGCDSIIITTLTVNPVLISTQSVSICSGSTYTLPGGNVVSTGGTYNDTLTSVSGCDSIVATALTVDSVFTSSQSASVCSGSTYTLPGGTIVNTGGAYIDTLIAVGGCDSVITTTLTVNPKPSATVVSIPTMSGHIVTIAQGQSVTLTASGGGTYSWSNGENSSSITVNPPVTTMYCVTVTDANNCSDTVCVTVTVIIEPIDCSNAGELYLPNAFSPNGDGENDFLQVYYGNIKCIKVFKLVIYNRWGEKVFETNDPSAGWDGFFRGDVEGTAVFVYYLEVMLISGKEIIKKGNISLMR